MTGFFTEVVVAALSSWPVVLVVALILFRKQLAAKLEGLVTFSIANSRADFEKRLDEVKVEAESLVEKNPTARDEPTIPPEAQARLDYQEENARSQPGVSIALAWKELEESALRAADREGLEDLSYYTPTDRVLKKLSEASDLPPETAWLARDLRRLRDLALDSRANRLPANEVRDYVAATRKLIESIERSTRDG